MKRLTLLVLMLPLLVGWTYVTPGGIKVKANKKAIEQYAAYWKRSWGEIDWEALDRLWNSMQRYYFGLGFEEAPKVKRNVKVTIKPWDPKCVDENGNPNSKEFRSEYGCIDGLYPGKIHLGDDDGYGPDAFCLTAISHEWAHVWIQRLKIPGCFYGLDSGIPGCMVFDPGMHALGLCK